MTAKTMPTWLADQLIADGVMDTARITKTAKPRTCPNCHRGVLAAIDDIVAHRIPAKFGLDPIRDIQVLTPMHRGPAGAGPTPSACSICHWRPSCQVPAAEP